MLGLISISINSHINIKYHTINKLKKCLKRNSIGLDKFIWVNQIQIRKYCTIESIDWFKNKYATLIYDGLHTDLNWLWRLRSKRQNLVHLKTHTLTCCKVCRIWTSWSWRYLVGLRTLSQFNLILSTKLAQLSWAASYVHWLRRWKTAHEIQW